MAKKPQEVTKEKSIDPTPKKEEVVGEQITTIKVTIFNTGRQDVSVETPKTSPLTESLGVLEIAKAILLKKNM